MAGISGGRFAAVVVVVCLLQVSRLSTRGQDVGEDYYTSLEVYNASSTEVGDTKPCGGTLDLSSDPQFLASPGYPQTHPSNLDCRWEILGQNYVELNLHKLDLEQEDGACPYDYLQMIDGDGIEYPRLCGKANKTIFRLKPPVTVIFVADDSIQKTGFLIRFHETRTGNQDQPPCEYHLRSSLGLIQSPNYPGRYPNNALCRWTIQARRGHQVELKFVTFDVEPDPYCRLDAVVVDWGGAENQTLCGSIQIPPIISTGNAMRIMFQSDDRGQHNGFEAEYSTFTDPDLPPPPGEGGLGRPGENGSSACRQQITAREDGLISSPNYPDPYPGGINCSWSIRARPGEVLRLNFLSFTLEQVSSNGSCSADGLRWYDNNQLITTFCGTSRPGGYGGLVSNSNHVTLVMFTDAVNHYKGFLMEYRVQPRQGPPEPPLGPGQEGPEGPDDSYGIEMVSSFLCQNGLAVALVDTCNGDNDCGDDSDESPEYAGCTASFECRDGSRIASYQRCDGYVHCDDGSDEGNAAGCTDFYPCEDGSIIPASYRCDEVIDCADGSDEGALGSCIGDPCVSNPCLHGSTCLVDGSTFYCECPPQWSGIYCERDSENNCAGKPCRNGGTCYDQVGTYLCACQAGYYGSNCETAVGISEEFYIVLSTMTGRDNTSCGSAQTPCQSLEYALARAPEEAIILINQPLTGTVTLTGGWIRRSVSLVGSLDDITTSGLTPVIFADTVIAGDPGGGADSRPRVNINGLQISGHIYVGDAVLSLSQSELREVVIQQEFQRRSNITFLRYIIQDCRVQDSRLVARNDVDDQGDEGMAPSMIGSDGNRYTSLARFDLSIAGSTVSNSLVSLVAEAVSVRIRETSLSATTTTMPTRDDGSAAPSGVYVRIGRWRSLGGKMVPTATNTTAQSATSGSQSTSRRKKRSTHDSQSSSTGFVEGGSIIAVRHSSFQGFRQGRGGLDGAALAVSVGTIGNFVVEVEHTDFRDNGRAMNVWSSGARRGTIFISNCNFRNNTGLGPGGAVNIEHEKGVVSAGIDNSTFVDNSALAFTRGGGGGGGDDTAANVDLSRVSRITGSGGALAVSITTVQVAAGTRAVVEVKNCTFSNNTAENYGGTAYFTGYVSASILDCSMENTPSGVTDAMRPSLGEILESRGNLLLRNLRLNVRHADDTVAILSYRADRDGSYMDTTNLGFFCPRGFQTAEVFNAVVGATAAAAAAQTSDNATSGSSSSSSSWSSSSSMSERVPIETLLLYCRACKKGSYTLQNSGALMNGVEVLYTTINTCNNCPYGATCDASVMAKTNFWGEATPVGQLRMHACPSGYCCQSATCSSYDQCAEDRQGPLCGSCRPGYSESLFSTRCVPNASCSYLSPMWALVAAYGFGYVLFFIFEEEIELIVFKFMAWFKSRLGRCCKREKKAGGGRGSSKADGGSSLQVKDGSVGYLNIFMYYIQVSELLKVELLYDNEREKPLSAFSEQLMNVFSFDTLGLNAHACFFADVTAVVKRLLQTSFILYMFAVWIVTFVLGALLHCCLAGGPRRTIKWWVTPTTLKAKYLGALVNLLLYTYQYFAENSFSVLRCVDVASSARPVLFIDGTVACYQAWQYGVMAFVAVYVFPFFAVLTLGPDLLRLHRIRVSVFIFAVLFPLFGTPYLLYVYIQRRRHDPYGLGLDDPPRRRRHRQHADDRDYDIDGGHRAAAGRRGRKEEEEEEEEVRGSVLTVTEILTDPYRDDPSSGLCWEGMVALRRLLIVMVATLTTNALLRQLIITLLCYLSLALHLRRRPFAARFSNTLESLSLGTLLLISMMNLLKAVFVDSGEVPKAMADTIFNVYDWVEDILLSLLPLVVVGFVGLAIVVRVVGFFVECCCGRTCCREEGDEAMASGFDEFDISHRRPKRKRKGLNSVQIQWVMSGNDRPQRRRGGGKTVAFDMGDRKSHFPRRSGPDGHADDGENPEDYPPHLTHRGGENWGGFAKEESEESGDLGWPGGKTGNVHTRPNYQGAHTGYPDGYHRFEVMEEEEAAGASKEA